MTDQPGGFRAEDAFDVLGQAAAGRLTRRTFLHRSAAVAGGASALGLLDAGAALARAGGDTTSIHDTVYGFTGDYVTGDATIDFRARKIGSNVRYRSDSGGQTTGGPPGVGTERNGAFFS